MLAYVLSLLLCVLLLAPFLGLYAALGMVVFMLVGNRLTYVVYCAIKRNAAWMFREI